MTSPISNTLRAWVFSAEMGYGHHRAVHPLKDIAEDGIMDVRKSGATTPKEEKQWKRLLGAYEFFSRSLAIPVVGKPLFNIIDGLGHIPSFYPIRDLSGNTVQVDMLASSIKGGMCKGMLQTINTKQLPLITSFYAPAIAADMAGYHQVYCIICDADLNRVWVAKEPWESRINYFAPCGKAAQRLKSYGVPEERIFLTGFPLSDELLGGPDLTILKADLGQRLHYLDPNNRFWPMHGRSVEHFLGADNCRPARQRVLTISYAVGGAGAQKEMGGKIVRSLKKYIQNGELHINLISGIRKEVRDYFLKIKEEIAPDSDGIRVLYSPTLQEYFSQFDNIMHETDILWTKPSELSFYVGLGIPIIMTPTIGSQEKFNRQWLFEIQAGIKQENPDHADQWLFDWLSNGRLAEAAWSGFLKARKLGVYKIKEVLETGKMTKSDSPVLR
ncbi:MAG: DUF6938 domain-containing protein [Bacteroidota bacterium]